MSKKKSIQQRVKKTLDSQKISLETCNDLQDIRNRALDSSNTSSPVYWKPLAFASLVLVLAVAMLVDVSDEAKFPGADIEDFVVISSDEDLEFFEDLEFYVWIDEENQV